MIGIGEENARAEFLERFLCEALDRCRGAHGHEHRRFNDAVWRAQTPAPRAAGISLQNVKGKVHALSVSGENKRPEHLDGNHGAPDREGNHIGLAPR